MLTNSMNESWRTIRDDTLIAQKINISEEHYILLSWSKLIPYTTVSLNIDMCPKEDVGIFYKESLEPMSFEQAQIWAVKAVTDWAVARKMYYTSIEKVIKNNKACKKALAQ